MRITLPGGTPAELAVHGDAAHPSRGVVVIPDIGGLRPLFDEMCARLAQQYRWAVCAPEPFPGREHLELAGRMEAMADRIDDQVLADIAHAADLLDSKGASPIAVIGFCQGGMYAFKASGSGRFDKAVAFYGMIRVPEQWRGEGQRDAIDYVSQPGACPVLAILGGRDEWTPAADIADLEKLANVDIAFYPEGEHGFVHDPSRPSHRPEDAADAWHRVNDFLS